MKNILKKIVHKFGFLKIKEKIRIRKIEKVFLQRDSKIFFIVSTGRTGTKFFERFLHDNFQNVYAVHEPRPDMFDIGTKKIREKTKRSEIVQYIKNNRINELEKSLKQSKNIYVETNPFNSFILEELIDVFPNAKFIILYRNPEDYVKSALNKSPISDPSKMMFYAENDGRKRISAKDYSNDKYYNQWDKFNRIEKISWYWNKCNLELLNFSEKYPEKSLSLKYEEVFDPNVISRRTTLIKFLDFLNLNSGTLKLDVIIEEMTKKANQTEKLLYEGYNNWSEAEKDSFDEITNEVKKILKY
jgi:hypothetical protein